MKKIRNESDRLNKKTDQNKRLIRIRTVVSLTGLSKSYIYQLCDRGLFPKSILLVPGGLAVAWVEQEVLSWIKSRIEARDQRQHQEVA